MPLADTIIALKDGAVVETGSPGPLLQEDGYIQQLGIKISSKQDAKEDASLSDEIEETTPGNETSRHSEEPTPSRLTADHTDLRRKNSDKTIYKYYFSSAGYSIVAIYLVFITLMIFCIEFPSLFAPFNPRLLRYYL